MIGLSYCNSPSSARYAYCDDNFTAGIESDRCPTLYTAGVESDRCPQPPKDEATE